MKITMILADSAQVAGDKLFLLGGGWRYTSAPTAPSAIGLIVEVGWDETNKRHNFVLELVDADGKAVLLPGGGDMQFQTLRVEGAIEAGRPPGIKPGSAITVPWAVNFGPLPLEPNREYTWRITFNNNMSQLATCSFATVPGQG